MKNIGILGFAHGHVGMYCERWRENPDMGIHVLCGWDHDENRLRKAADQYGLEAMLDRDELLARPDCEAVVIASETALHAELTEAAAGAGKAIILQKPMALTMAQADLIVEAVNRTGVPFSMTWQMRTDLQNLKIKELLDEGVIGKVLMVRRRHGLSAHTWPWIFDSWHIDPEQNRDLWADDAAHAVDFIYWLLGLPATVTAEMGTLLDPRIPNDNGIAIYRYENGPIAEVTCSFTSIAAENTVEIFGERGTIIQNFGDGLSCRMRLEGEPGLKWIVAGDAGWTYSDIETPPAHGERIAGLAGSLAEFLYGKRRPVATAEEGRDALRMLLACYVSNRDGRRVSMFDGNISAI